MKKTILLSLFASLACLAQPVIAPSSEPVGKPRGNDTGDYNITNSFETGYRFFTVDGNAGKYRSDVNFGNGIRLLGSNLTINSKDGHGAYFDELLLSTQGLGNDPYEFASLRVQKNGLYSYGLLWRQNDYFNPALTISGGEHFMNTSRKLQDHSLVLLPQSKIRFILGYSRNSQDGPALTTMQLFDARGDDFPLFSNIRRTQDEYRIGNEIQLAGFRLSWMRTWEFFKDDSTDSSTGLSAGNNPNDRVTLTSFYRAQPYHGTTRGWRVNLLTDRSKLYSLNGRFAYAGGRRDFIYDESALGTDRIGAARNRQVFVLGNARRPVTAANLTASLFPTSKLTIVNHTAFHSTRMDGNSSYAELNNATLGLSQLNFQFLGIRTIANATDLNYRATEAVTFYGGYHFSTRRIRSIEQTVSFQVPDTITAEQDNTLHAGLFGVRVRPIKRLIVSLDAEIGRADHPIYPISEKNYQVLGGRIQYKAKTFQLGAMARTNYNTNSISFVDHSYRSRTYSADASWTPLTWFGFDATYSKLHLNTLSAIAYFANGDLVTGDHSAYFSNIHSGNIAARFGLAKRVDLFVGYSRVQDVGDGRAIPNPPNRFSSLFADVQTFPVAFESPFARISLKINTRLRWNAGYQYYRYFEEFSTAQNYRANTGFTSLTWSF
jgi:hypothetical protein